MNTPSVSGSVKRQAAAAASPLKYIVTLKIGPRTIPKRHHRPNVFNLTLQLNLCVFIPLDLDPAS